MTPAQFIGKWSRIDLAERAASQEHFIDLCRLLGQPTPAEHDGAELETPPVERLGGCWTWDTGVICLVRD